MWICKESANINLYEISNFESKNYVSESNQYALYDQVYVHNHCVPLPLLH